MKLPPRVNVNDVMLRDGLQLEDKILTINQKQRLVDEIIDANIKTIEFGSFVHPKLVPQMSNSGELFNKIKQRNGVEFVSLIPNLQGANIAHNHGVKIINYVFSASNTHNIQNVHQTTKESLNELEKIESFCVSNNIEIRVSIATSFGCPFEGEIKQNKIVEIINYLLNYKINYVTLADTTGVANPKQVYDLMKKLTSLFPNSTFNMHFHNTRGLGLANVIASMQAGITNFDASLGGLGGCPFAPGATGNISTEDLVHMLEQMGIETGIQLDNLLKSSKTLKEYIAHDLDSAVFRAGKADITYEIE